jgi:uncharacterized protein (DUF2141 family)
LSTESNAQKDELNADELKQKIVENLKAHIFQGSNKWGGCTKAAFQSGSIYFELNSAEDVCRLFFTADLPDGKYTLNAAYSVDGNNVIITITDSSGAIRTTSTTTFGYYRFDDVQAGETYIISARGKRFTLPSLRKF